MVKFLTLRLTKQQQLEVAVFSSCFPPSQPTVAKPGQLHRRCVSNVFFRRRDVTDARESVRKGKMVTGPRAGHVAERVQPQASSVDLKSYVMHFIQ